MKKEEGAPKEDSVDIKEEEQFDSKSVDEEKAHNKEGEQSASVREANNSESSSEEE